MNTAELQPRTDVFTHHTPNFSEIHTHVRIDAMTEEEKLQWLSGPMLKTEHELLRAPYGINDKRAESAIIFLTGGGSGDVTEERDFEGNLIHTRHLDRPRPMAAELSEATNAISHWFDLVRQSQEENTPMPSPVAPLSEIADVVYNVSHLMTLDPAFKNVYHEYLHQVASSLGYKLDQLLTITVYKYNFRLGQGKSQKNIAIENSLIENVLAKTDANGKHLYPHPSEFQFQKAFQTLFKIQRQLNARYDQLEQDYEWKKNSL